MLEIVSDDAIAAIADRIDFAAAVRAAYVAASAAGARSAPVVRLPAEELGGAVNVKFGLAERLVGGKIGTYWNGNAEKGLPNHGAATILLDPETGFPRAFLAARLLNRLRTAAGDAVAVAALARPDAGVLAVIGAGAQALFEARAVARIRPIREIRIAGRSADKAVQAAAELAGVAADVRACTIREAVAGADIIVTATPARAPVVEAAWVKPGAHISAMGADAAGKQELDPALLSAARFFADLPEQSIAIGEGQHLEGGRPQPLGHVLTGQVAGRTADDQITIFDSSGVAIQDLFVAEAALAAARDAGFVQRVAL